VREEAAGLLRCPRCRSDGSLRLQASATARGEVREGTLTCTACGHLAAVRDGIADLLHDPPARVVREADGLRRFADVMRADGWDRERVLRLPDEPSPFWHGQRAAFAALQRQVAFVPGQRLLDTGSNTCWASAAFARQGLQVTALDIAPHLMQGLGTMFDLPLASGTVDHVFCCEVLHHNSPADLFRTLREAHRVLAPGGTLSVIRETLRAPLTPQLRPGHEVADFEGNEHAFLASTYLVAARAAGFAVTVRDPAGHWVLSDAPFATEGARRRARLKLAVLDTVRRRPRSRRLYRAYLHHVAGTVPFSFTATT
jgi:SAM-dependent methyltransferase